jgi:hypothetical protein
LLVEVVVVMLRAFSMPQVVVLVAIEAVLLVNFQEAERQRKALLLRLRELTIQLPLELEVLQLVKVPILFSVQLPA